MNPKYLYRTLIILTAAVSVPAMANNNPPPTPPTGTTYNVDQQQAAQAAAKAAALAAAAAKSAAEASSDSGSYSANDINLMTQHSSKTFVFPAPVWTQLPETRGCFVTESHALAGGWNFVSGSKSVQFSDPICMSGRMSESARTMCQFLTADHIDRNTYRTLWPNAKELPAAVGLKNLSLEECEALKRPRLALTTTITPPPAVVVPPPVVVPPAPPAPPVAKPKPRAKPKAVVPCDKVTVERQICVPKKK